MAAGASKQAAGRLPATAFPIGTHLSTPVVLPGGAVYGTLCCFSFGVNERIAADDMRRLRYTALLTGQKIQEGRIKQAQVAEGPAAPTAPPARNP